VKTNHKLLLQLPSGRQRDGKETTYGQRNKKKMHVEGGPKWKPAPGTTPHRTRHKMHRIDEDEVNA